MLHPATAFYVDSVLNFHYDWFLYFLKYVDFHVSIFWLEIAYSGAKNLRFYEVNMGYILKLNILTPKDAKHAY